MGDTERVGPQGPLQPSGAREKRLPFEPEAFQKKLEKASEADPEQKKKRRQKEEEVEEVTDIIKEAAKKTRTKDTFAPFEVKKGLSPKASLSRGSPKVEKTPPQEIPPPTDELDADSMFWDEGEIHLEERPPLPIEKELLPPTVEKEKPPLPIEKGALPLPTEKEIPPPTVEKEKLPLPIEKGALPLPTEKERLPPTVEKEAPIRGAIAPPAKPAPAPSAAEELKVFVPPLKVEEAKRKKGVKEEVQALPSPIEEVAAPPTLAPPLIAPPPPVVETTPYMQLPPQALALFEKMVGVMTVMVQSGVRETTFTLTAEPFKGSHFFGAEVVIREYSTAPMQYNVELKGSQEAVAQFQANIPYMESALRTGGYNFGIHRIETSLKRIEEEPVSREKKERERE